jgi:hypothetical protein
MWNPKHQGKWQEHGKEETNVKKKKNTSLLFVTTIDL